VRRVADQDCGTPPSFHNAFCNPGLRIAALALTGSVGHALMRHAKTGVRWGVLSVWCAAFCAADFRNRRLCARELGLFDPPWHSLGAASRRVCEERSWRRYAAARSDFQ